VFISIFLQDGGYSDSEKVINKKSKVDSNQGGGGIVVGTSNPQEFQGNKKLSVFYFFFQTG
jgi:hypothetical protein